MRRILPLSVTLVAAIAAALAAASLVAVGAHASGHPDARRPATRTEVVRPVDAAGHPVKGWAVTREKGSASCSGSSPAAVSDDIVTCYPTAFYLPACWTSTRHTVLCVRDARKQKLVRVHYQGTIKPVTAPTQPSPLNMDLGNGERCSLRIGGAWGTLPSHPSWMGFASCTGGSVYGPGNGDGINRSHVRWTVHEWRNGTKQVVDRRGVNTAYVVGTAG